MTYPDSGEPERPRLILVLGGARSGKSSYAEALAARIAGTHPVLYIATATAEDAEMEERIARHQAARPPHWHTVEAPGDPASALREYSVGGEFPVILLDCMTLLVSNLLLGGTHADFDEQRFDATAAEGHITSAISDLLAAWRETQATLILVSNEVGMGLVPPYPLGRVYRDALGRANARLAQEADVALLLVAGLPVELKALSSAWSQKATRLFGPEE